MRTSIESSSSQTPKPQISLLERNAQTKAGKFPGHQEKVSELKIPVDPSKLKKFEYDELLVKARNRILSNDFVAKLVSAMAEKSSENESVRKLVEVENNLVEACIDLTDIDIDNLIGQLNRKSLQYISENRHVLNLSTQAYEDIYSGRWNPFSAGIKSVVNFIRERSKLLMSKPSQRFVIGFNDKLDVDRKIDLMEVILGETSSNIEQLNLIQVKNSLPTKEEIIDIIKEHRNFVNDDILHLGDIEDFELPEEKERRLFEETLSNQTIMLEKIFEICVGYQKMNPEKLIEVFGLGNLSDFQRAWILDTYFETLKEQIETACSEGYIGEQDRDNLIRDLQSLHKALIKKAGIPAHIIHINSINSIIAVGPKIMRQVNLYDSKSSRDTLTATV